MTDITIRKSDERGGKERNREGKRKEEKEGTGRVRNKSWRSTFKFLPPPLALSV